jgi:hypothetical protein
MKMSKKFIISELKDFKRVFTLLCKGSGSLSDYLLMTVICCGGLVIGFLTWGI